MKISEAMRHLRPFLPPGFKKIPNKRWSTGWYYGDQDIEDGRTFADLAVQFEVACRWDDVPDKEVKSCDLYKVVILVSPSFSRTRRQPRGLRNSSVRARKDGTFNWEMVGARIQKNLEQIESLKQARIEREKENEQFQKAHDNLRDTIRKEIQARGGNLDCLDGYVGADWVPGGVQLSIKHTNRDCSVQLDGISPEDLFRLLRFLNTVAK